VSNLCRSVDFAELESLDEELFFVLSVRWPSENCCHQFSCFRHPFSANFCCQNLLSLHLFIGLVSDYDNSDFENLGILFLSLDNKANSPLWDGSTQASLLL